MRIVTHTYDRYGNREWRRNGLLHRDELGPDGEMLPAFEAPNTGIPQVLSLLLGQIMAGQQGGLRLPSSMYVGGNKVWYLDGHIIDGSSRFKVKPPCAS